MATINVGKEFSPDPSGRFYSDGTASGEQFREEFLVPALKKLVNNEKLIIIIDDGVETYGSSFLTEGFANIVKYGYFTAQELQSKIEISYTNEDFSFFKEKITQYIKESKYNSKQYVTTKHD